MSPYHQGPPLPISSSPILPLDVQLSRHRRPSPLPFEPRLALSGQPHVFSNTSVALSSHHSGLATESPRSIPSHWTSDTPTVHLDVSHLDTHHGRNTIDVTSAASSSPFPPSHPLPSTPVGWDAPVNFIPYAPFAHHPDGGTTIFYRSPTQSARQRTNQACEKCRDRKTKCSGGRPTCVRCQTRGLVCEYANEHRARGPSRARKRSIPSFEPPMSAPSTRPSFAHHPYAPAPAPHSRWNLQTASFMAPDVSAGTRSGWSLADHSDESSDSSGAASYEHSERNAYPIMTDAQGAGCLSTFTRQGSTATGDPSHRSHHVYRSAVDIKERLSVPVLRVSSSMSQINHALHESNGGNHSFGSCPNTPYSATADLNGSFVEYLSEKNVRERCPSTSSSCASRSQLSADDNLDSPTTPTSSDTMLLGSWSSARSLEKHDLWKSQDSLNNVVNAVDAEGETPQTPKPPSDAFNVSEWITGADFSSSPERQASSVETATAQS